MVDLELTEYNAAAAEFIAGKLGIAVEDVIAGALAGWIKAKVDGIYFPKGLTNPKANA